MNVTCPVCGKTLGMADSAPRREGRCPRCRSVLPIDLVVSGDIQNVCPFKQGDVVVGCRIDRLVGCGGMAGVYEATQLSLGRKVAVKVLSAELAVKPASLARFAREARVLADLNHPNIVEVFDRGSTDDGHFYILMGFVDGASFRQVMHSKKISEQAKLELLLPVCDALTHAHEKGVVHRDLKPENILVDRRGNVKIVDFGIAALPEGEGRPNLTMTRAMLGTPDYMAPEQRQRAKAVDGRADIYSLGVILYELIAGHRPVGAFAPPGHENRDYPFELDSIVMRCLAPHPDNRHTSARSVADAIRGAIETAHEPVFEMLPVEREPVETLDSGPSLAEPGPPQLAPEARRRKPRQRIPGGWRRHPATKIAGIVVIIVGALLTWRLISSKIDFAELKELTEETGSVTKALKEMVEDPAHPKPSEKREPTTQGEPSPSRQAYQEPDPPPSFKRIRVFPLGTKDFPGGLSPDGQKVVIRNEQNKSQVFDVASGERLVELAGLVEGHPSFYKARFSPKGDRIVIAEKGYLTVYSTDSGSRLWTHSFGQTGYDNVYDVQWAPDGTSLAVLIVGHKLRHLHLDEGDLPRPSMRANGAKALCLLPNHRLMMIDTFRAEVKIREVKPEAVTEPSFELLCHQERYGGVAGAVDPDLRFLARSPWPLNTTEIYDLKTGKVLRVLQTAASGQTAYLAVSLCGRYLFTAAQQVRVWDTTTWEELGILGRRRLPGTICLSRNGRRIAVPIDQGYAIYELPEPSPSVAARLELTTQASPSIGRVTIRVPKGFRATPETAPEPYTQTGWAKEIIHEKTGIEMVFVPAGDFRMGSGDGDADEKPPHKVRITKPFYMGECEVSVAQFRKFAEATSHKTETEHEGGAYVGQLTPVMKPGATWQAPGYEQSDEHPVSCISHFDAVAFCNWAGLALPTEAQWEYACRAGEQDSGTSESALPDPNSMAWSASNSDHQAHSVGGKEASSWGLHDMLGNVEEWCADFYGVSYYADSPTDDPPGPSYGTRRVIRGASWMSTPGMIRPSNREGALPGVARMTSGFRVAFVPQEAIGGAMEDPGGGLAGPKTNAQIVITADNGYTLYVNGALKGKDDNWETVERYPLHLKRGDVIQVHARDRDGGKRGLCGIYAEIRFPQGTIATNRAWRWLPMSSDKSVPSYPVGQKPGRPAYTVTIRGQVGKAAARGGLNNAKPIWGAGGECWLLLRIDPPFPVEGDNARLRVPTGFRVLTGTVLEPYTNTGWAKEIIHEKTGIRMVFIPAGEFHMGSNGDRPDERPIHRARLTQPFYMGKFPVTVGEFARFADEHNYQTLAERSGGATVLIDGRWPPVKRPNASWRKPYMPQTPRHPVVSISWEDADAFCEAMGLSLPTEAQWEYACRAGSTGSYCFAGDARKLTEYAWYAANSGIKTHPVGKKLPNSWGLYDMHGQVWEWCADWYGERYYSSSPAEDPPGPASGSIHVFRGGCFPSGPEYATSSFRGLKTYPHCANYGFRAAFAITQRVLPGDRSQTP